MLWNQLDEGVTSVTDHGHGTLDRFLDCFEWNNVG